ncbi:ComF family protein [Candidatus Saccharibacteria bacterium TM7i]|nr:ComF family protein [Candidatus Saccharibacteria bacterium TM7i]
MIGSYEDGLKKALEGLKFCNDRFVSEPLAELLAIRAPFFPTDAVVTPIPTLRASIRRRGYDQAFLLARAFARRRGLEMRRLVERSGSFVQHDTESRLQRERQVRGSFTIKANTSIPETVILIDDIITTGATVNEVAKVLRQVGVVRVYVMAIAHPI